MDILNNPDKAGQFIHATSDAGLHMRHIRTHIHPIRGG